MKPKDNSPAQMPEQAPAEVLASTVLAAKPVAVKVKNIMPGGVDRMCNCSHTLGAHYKANGVCADAAECKCEGFYPAEFE